MGTVVVVVVVLGMVVVVEVGRLAFVVGCVVGFSSGVVKSSSSPRSELNSSDKLMSFGSFFVTILLYTSPGLFVVNVVVGGSGRKA